jgi:hypothetical protein
MVYNIDYTNLVVIFCHATVITQVILLYYTEFRCNHGMAVNLQGKKVLCHWPLVILLQKGGRVKIRHSLKDFVPVMKRLGLMYK